MPFYKTATNQLFFLGSESEEGFLPQGAQRITDEEAEVIRLANLAQTTPQVPQVVTMRQARLALLQNGLLAQVETAIANLPGTGGDAARIEWEYSQTINRNHSLVTSLSSVLSLTEQQLDDLFTLASSL